MKLVQSSLTMAAMIVSSRSVYGQWNPDDESCDGCMGHADKFQSCVKESCIDDKLYCMLAPPFSSSVTLGNCCNFGSDCSEAAKKLDICTGYDYDCGSDSSKECEKPKPCLPSCVESSIAKYLSCSYKSSLQDTCVMSDCVTKIALDRDWINVTSKEDNFLEKLGESLEDQQFSNDCTSTSAKALEVCKIGQSCCDGCNPELGMVMHCIVNEVIRPWQKEETTRDSFDSDDDECADLSKGRNNKPGEEACCGLLDGECERRQRQLTDLEGTTGGVVNDKVAAATEKCMEGMKWNVALGNSTAAGSDTMNCVVVEGARMLESGGEEEAPKESNSAASPKSVLSAAFLVVAAAAVFA